MNKITKEGILESLSKVMDPDLKKDLVSLGMIENIVISEQNVKFDLVLTTPACPLKNVMKNDCIKEIQQMFGKGVNVDVNLTSRSHTMHDNKEILPKVKNIIAVVSGKGGVGKSTVSANIAVSLAKLGAKVGLLDADIYGPSVPIMFGIGEDEKPLAYEEGEKIKIEPIEKYGVKLLSIGFFIDQSQALIWRGPMASNYLQQLVENGDWGELDYLVIDMPPGTGDIHLTLVQNIPVTGAVIVTTPQKVALTDAEKAINMLNAEKINVKIFGVVENMAWFTPKELPDNKYFLFGKNGGKNLAEKYNLPLLGQIPIVQSISDSGDAGEPIAFDEKTIDGKEFLNLTENLVRQISIQNKKDRPTRVVEISK